jgi:hypothetical protein
MLQLGALDECKLLAVWATNSGLLAELAEGCLLVLDMDAAPLLAQGFAGVEALTNTLLMAIVGADNLQGFVMAT